MKNPKSSSEINKLHWPPEINLSLKVTCSVASSPNLRKRDFKHTRGFGFIISWFLFLVLYSPGRKGSSILHRASSCNSFRIQIRSNRQRDCSWDEAESRMFKGMWRWRRGRGWESTSVHYISSSSDSTWYLQVQCYIYLAYTPHSHASTF